jgi:alkylhydroperoxidase/carboxymuconolactone decarboxylase family protein YurZ
MLAAWACTHPVRRRRALAWPFGVSRAILSRPPGGISSGSGGKGVAAVASIAMVPEAEATGKVAAIYAEIRATHGIDFVPNLYKVMAAKPDYLEANWSKVKAVMAAPGKLDRLTKEIIAVAVSAVNGCDY